MRASLGFSALAVRPLCLAGWRRDLPRRPPGPCVPGGPVLTATVDWALELVLRVAAALVGHVLHGRDVVHELTAAWTWSTAVWPAVALVAAVLLVGLWTAFWDD